ncbi:hypothetical protein HMPREF2943_03110 [Corynebacterium sp. HMSC072D12]|uniref:hypothetical protein n=1 Tax=Corynebacterium sp. HMSC072D12 TaxID=1739447 RepID=UPI0008A16832|nr:hypothetical protein [Corynebacterium sp. HMSC072D12]OFQ34016.1 hypothetical protein HMPREF2943_03110 [Corynebacterium sp. HMSC072D12]
MSSIVLNLDTDVTTLTSQQLEELRQACWEKDAEVSHEQKRRDALPFVWEAEVTSVKTLRQVTSTTPTPGAAYATPTSLLDAYIAGDTVTADGKTWYAVGQGAIFTAPGLVDPVQGEAWKEVPEDQAGTDGDGEAEAMA